MNTVVHLFRSFAERFIQVGNASPIVVRSWFSVLCYTFLSVMGVILTFGLNRMVQSRRNGDRSGIAPAFVLLPSDNQTVMQVVSSSVCDLVRCSTAAGPFLAGIGCQVASWREKSRRFTLRWHIGGAWYKAPL